MENEYKNFVQRLTMPLPELEAYYRERRKERFEKRFVINFGNELFPKDFDDNTSLTQRLRDDLATLKWEIWEQEGIQSRKDIPADYSEQFIRQFAQRIYPYDTLESVERTRYHTKEEMEQRDAFAHLDRLIPCKGNAF